MRVVAGSARGRRLRTPSGNEVRPTSDRVREATFNALESLGVLQGATVLDLFAGSGALGIEALSRGADHVTFVDSSPQALAAVRDNLSSCGLAQRATVRRADALVHLASRPHPDLTLLDPPYSFDGWADLLGLVDSPVVVIESDRSIQPPAPLVVQRERRYGGTVVIIATQADRDDHGRRPSEDRT